MTIESLSVRIFCWVYWLVQIAEMGVLVASGIFKAEAQHAIPADVPELGISQSFDGREISCDMTDSHTGVMVALYGTSLQESTVRFSGFEYAT